MSRSSRSPVVAATAVAATLATPVACIALRSSPDRRQQRRRSDERDDHLSAAVIRGDDAEAPEQPAADDRAEAAHHQIAKHAELAPTAHDRQHEPACGQPGHRPRQQLPHWILLASVAAPGAPPGSILARGSEGTMPRARRRRHASGRAGRGANRRGPRLHHGVAARGREARAPREAGADVVFSGEGEVALASPPRSCRTSARHPIRSIASASGSAASWGSGTSRRAARDRPPVTVGTNDVTSWSRCRRSATPSSARSRSASAASCRRR